MILKFETENYKSFKDRITFSMIPASKQKGLDYSILCKTVGKRTYKGLCTAVVYGANAAGKTNIIGAMQVFKNIVLRGNIINATQNSMNPADYSLELIPNSTLTKKKPVFFALQFIQDEFLIEYSLKIDLGTFMDRSYARSVEEEVLKINERLIFSRSKNTLSFSDLRSIDGFLLPNFRANLPLAQEIAQGSLRNEDLFLMNGFKTIVSIKLAECINDYFSHYFQTFYHAEMAYFAPRFPKESTEIEYLNDAANAFGINSNKLMYVKDKNDVPVLCSVFGEKNKRVLPADIFESYGTLRFVNVFPMVAKALQKGTTVIIDEFDSAIHPMAIMNIINIFHNDEINIHHAQLIFNTHNPLYLNNNLLRRDEIKFVERNDETKCSVHYALSDFGTKGTNARKGKDYMKNYFINKYGAIRNVDFASVLEKIIKG